MNKTIMIGCDLHDVSLVLKVADERVRRCGRVSHGPAGGDDRLGQGLRRAAGVTRIVLAYEASGQGFGLYDNLTEAGIE